MSLAVADKLLRAFEALKNFKDGTATSESNVASTAKKKEVTLSKKDRISNLNVIGDLTCSPLLRNLSEFGKLIAVSIETLLSFCDDEEPDVRLVAGDCVNRIIKGFMDANVARVHVELYKEIKKNGNSRCLRAALSKFAEICHLIRPHKCRPFITNLLPCLARICTREEEPVQETLAHAMKKIMPVLGTFMNDKETKVLLKTFLQNVSSTSAATRRTAASSITTICLHARKPEVFYSWVINILLGSMLPFSVDQNSPTYCGVLHCLRHIVPHLGNEEQENEVVMRGSFGVIHQQKRQGNEEMLENEEKQLLQMYKLIMLSTKHSDHNVVTAGLEALQHLLQSPPRKLLYQLLSQQGLAAFSSQDRSDRLLSTTLDDIDTLSFTSQQDSGIEEPLGEMSVDGASEKVGENGISVADIQELRRHFSQPQDETSEAMTDAVSEISDDGTEASSSLDTDNSSMLGHHRSGSSTSGIVTQASSTDELDEIETEEDMIAKDNEELELEPGENEGVDEGFDIDPVVCKGVPILHCARVMCSFLLSGKKGEILSDRLVRVSVKSLALNCLAAIFRIHPQAFLMCVVPEVDDEGINDGGNQQLIREILLYQGHHDPIIRGSLALLLGNFLQSSLIKSRYDFETWSLEICEEYKTDRVNIDVLLNALETLVLDESSVTVRLACLGIKECLPALCVSSYTALTLHLCRKMVQLKQNSYWLVKVELLDIISNINFSLIAFLERQASYLSSEQSNKLSCNLQQTCFHNVALELLADDDPRVRSEAAKTVVKLVQNMFHENNCASKGPLLAVAKGSLGETFGSSSDHENSVIKTNLAKVVTSLGEKLNVAISKHALLGYCEALSALSKLYPVPSWPACWSCEVHPITRSPSPTAKAGFTGNMFPTVPPPSEPRVSSILCNNGGGSLSFVVELVTSSWLTFNLHGHEDALLLCGNLFLGIASSSMSLGQSNVKSAESSGKWSVFADPEISVLADKVFVHVLRLLNICFHVIENVTPGAHSAKSSLLSKDKDKTPAPIPGAAVPTSNTAATASSISSPKKLLSRSLRKSDASEGANVGGDKGSIGKSSENEGKSSTPGAPLGQFHHLPHYYQLYEVVKGVFSNYKVNLKFHDDEKFVKLLKTTLTVFARFLELVTFSDIGKNVDEIIGYLQATVKCEAATTFLCVQQMVRAIFGVNVATQPENSSSNCSQQKDALITEVLLPPCLEVSCMGSSDVGFYQSCYEEFQQEISRSFDEIRKSDQAKESSKSFKDFSFIKRLRQRRGSFRPPIKVDKQIHVHSYIRMFEPLVIQALKDYTGSSDIQVQAQVLSILVQLIRLRVNYALLDSEQAFLNFVLKQFEFIQAGQIRRIEAFSPHMFQFLILLSYECFQPKFNQAKSVFGMSRIIQVCDDIMACGQSARKHAIPALCPIVYDLFDTQATGRNENSKELETQREVFISMLLRLAQFPEVLSLLVYVLTFYHKNDEKWKKFSRQAVDITLQMLIKQQVLIDDMDGLKCLESLFDSVAPIALRPLDVILKAIFAPANLPNALLKKRWLSQVIVLLKVIITQNTEENLLSRITQLGLTGGLIGNIVDDEELDASDAISETNPAKVMVYFLFHALYLAVRSSSVVSESQDKKSIGLISQLTSYLLLYMQEIVRSGLFKTVNSAGSSVIKEDLLNETSQVLDTKIKTIHEMFISLKETQPVLCLQWLQLVFLFEFHDENWWINLQGRMMTQDSCSVNGHIVVKGTFLVRCKILSAQLKHAENASTFQSFVKENLINIVEMSNEPPVKMLLRQIHSSSTCSLVFIDVSKDFCRSKPMPTLEFKKNLLVILDDLHYKQSNSLIQLLVTEFLSSHYRAITRKCETMICSRLEYCMSLPKEEFEEFFTSKDIKSIHNSLVTIGVTKRNPRLASLISHLSPESFNVPALESAIDCNAAIAAVKGKGTSDVNWFCSFVYNCCCCWKMSDVGIKSYSEVVHLLHALRFDEISRIMDDENFNTCLLSPCLAFGIKKTIEISSRKFDHETPSNPFEDTTYFDSYGVDHLFQSAFGLLLRHLQEIVFSVTTFDENQQQTRDPLSTSSKISLVQSTMNSSQVNELSKNFKWKQKLLDITKGLDVYLSFLDKLPTAAQLPEAIYCAVCQFGMIALEVLCLENRQCNHCCTSELTNVLHCFSRMLHSQHLYFVLNSSEYSSWVCHALRSVNCLVRTVFIHPGTTLPEDNVYRSLPDSEVPLKQASMLVHYLYTLLNHANHNSSVPDTLTRSFHDVITGLSRLTIFNSYVRIPPLVWKMGWGDDLHGTELPPLPIDILREKDVLQDFVLRVHSIGWISRQQFEETWAALLGVLSSPLSPEQTSREEDIDSIKSGCLALQCITALLLQTTLFPLPGNPSVGTNFHTSRQKELPFLDSRAGRKLCTVRRIVEDHFIQQCPESSTWQTGMDAGHFYGGNIERVSGLHSYSLGQICINSLQVQCVSVDSNELAETNTTSTTASPTLSPKDKIDVRSCVQFLMELFEQWVSPYTQPKTPLMLLTQSVKSLLIISDLFVDSAQYEWMLSELLDLYQNYPNEDEIMMQYLLPALCKALAVLKMEGVIPEKVVKIVEAAFKAPHVPLQVSGLYGALYLLESHISSVVNLVIPLVTDYVMKILPQVTDSSVFGEHRLLVLLSTSFYLLEHYDNEITDVDFKQNFLKTVILMASSGDENIPLHLYHAIIRGLERLVVSFSLSSEDSDSLVKFSVDRLAIRNPQKAISALGLLLTCMYTGKEGDRPSGLFEENETVDTPTDDVLLVALERVTALFDRIRKGFRSEAKLVSEILPVVLGDFFPPTDVMNKVIGEFLSSQQPHPELMASVLYKVCEQLISKGQQSSVKDWILLSLGSFAQRPPLGMAIWSFTCVFIAASTNIWIRALFHHVVSRIGKLENFDRTYFLITSADFYYNQNLTEDEKKSFLTTFETVAQTGTPYSDLIQNIV